MSDIYERRIWINNKTKLSASNMNHIEAGIEAVAEVAEEAKAATDSIDGIKEELAETSAAAVRAEALAEATAPIATKAHEEAEALKASKQDTLVDGETIKTINGKSILGAGNIEVATDLSDYYTKQETYNKEEVNDLIGTESYEEKDTESLDNLDLDNGIYKINAATESPTGTSGILHVKQLGDETVEQVWYSDEDIAVRLSKGEEPAPAKTYTLKVVCDGAEEEYISQSNQDPIEVNLDPLKEYDISGELYGSIVVGSNVEVLGNTKIRLKGVNIYSKEEYAIKYYPTNKKLTVEIFADTTNLITVVTPDLAESSSVGAIDSENNLYITGTGALTITSNWGHAIKASELIFNGEPNITVDVHHDAFHASKILRVTGGKYTIENANDCFSAGKDEDSAKTELTITGGSICVKACAEAIFQGKAVSGNYRIIKADVAIEDNSKVGYLFQEAGYGTESWNKTKVYDLAAFTGLDESREAEIADRKVVLADQYGDASVRFKDSEGEYTDVLADATRVFTLDKTKDEGAYYISGDLSGYSFITSVKSVDLYFNGVYCADDDDNLFIDYRNEKGRLEVNFTEGYINYIKKSEGSIFSSASNLSLKLKAEEASTGAQLVSIAYLEATNGTVMNANATESGRAAIASDGICYIQNSLLGAQAGTLWIGNECGDKGVESEWSKSDLSLYLRNNAVDVNLIWKDTDAYKKYGYIYAPYYFNGTAILGSNLAYENSGKQLDATSGTVDSSFANTPIVYTTCDLSDFEKNVNGVQYDADYVPEEIDPLDPSVADETQASGEWKVYKSSDPVDAYTKEESDARYVLKSAYDAKVAELEAENEALVSENEDNEKIIKKLQKTADRIADIAYSDLPKLTWTASENISRLYVVRGNSGYIDNDIWTKNNTTYSYHKNGQGYEEAGEDAQFNFVVEIPEGKALILDPVYESETKPYKNQKTSEYKDKDGAIVPNTYRIQYTQVTGSFNLSIDAKASYNVEYINGETYSFSKEAAEIPSVIAEGNDLIFKFYHLSDTSATPETEPTAAETLAKIDLITIGDTELELTEDLVTTTAGKKKATITIPAASITGNISIKLK